MSDVYIGFGEAAIALYNGNPQPFLNEVAEHAGWIPAGEILRSGIEAARSWGEL